MKKLVFELVPEKTEIDCIGCYFHTERLPYRSCDIPGENGMNIDNKNCTDGFIWKRIEE